MNDNTQNPAGGAQRPAADEPDTPRSKTAAATAGTASTDEDAADPDFAEAGTSKAFDRDQEALNLGLDDGDLDNDVPKDRR